MPGRRRPSSLPPSRSVVLLAAALFTSVACFRTASVPPPTRESGGVTLTEAAPPQGAVELGPIEAVHGHGCGVFGKNGTLEGASNALREQATRRGANFVRILESQEPHSTRACFDHEFRIRGVAYRTASAPAPSEACSPPCAAGYACHAARCEPLCDPPCAPNKSCRSDRTCVSSGP